METSPSSERHIVVIGFDDVGRRTVAMLQTSGVRVTHLDEPSDAVLREVLAEHVDGVAVLLHDDIRALRYCLVVHHIQADAPLYVAMFDQTARLQLQRTVPSCKVLSPASVSVPAFTAAILGGPADDPAVASETLATLRRRGLRGRLAGQLRPYDAGSAVLVVGVLGILVILAIETLLGLTHGGLARALYDAARTVATISSPTLPDESPLLIWATIAALLVMAFTAMFAAGLVNYLLSGRHVTLLGSRVVPRGGHVIIVGMGQVGLRLAQDLRHRGIAVLGIETDQHARLLPIARQAGIPVLIGDAGSRAVLRRAQVHTCFALVAAASSISDNIAVAVSALGVNPDVTVILRAGTDDAVEETRSLFPIGSVVDVNGLTARFVTEALASPGHP